MRRMIGALVLAAALALVPPPARGQWADQATWGGTSGGAANAQTITIGNWVAPVTGVTLRFKAGFTNTGATTLAVSGLTAIAVNKQSASGSIALGGGEIVAGQIYGVIYDGAVFQMVNTSPGSPVVVRTSATTAVAGNCGNTFALGGAAFYVFTLGAPGSFPANCSIIVTNADTGRGKGLNINGTAIRLMPGQTMTFTDTGVIWMQQPASNNVLPFWNSTSVPLFVNFTSGSDNPLVSDCLATGAGACKTFSNAVSIIQTYTAYNPAGALIQSDCDANHDEQVNFYTQSQLISLVGNPGNPGACAFVRSPASSIIFDVIQSQVSVSGFSFAFSLSGVALSVREFGLVNCSNCFFGVNTGGTHILATDLGNVNLTGTTTLNGAAATFAQATLGGQISVNGTVSVPGAGSAPFTNFFIATTLGGISGSPTYSITGTISGLQFTCSFNAIINMGTAYPGALGAGSSATGCQHNP